MTKQESFQTFITKILDLNIGKFSNSDKNSVHMSAHDRTLLLTICDLLISESKQDQALQVLQALLNFNPQDSLIQAKYLSHLAEVDISQATQFQ